MFWKWTTLIFFLISLLLGALIIGSCIRFAHHKGRMHRPFENIAEEYDLTDKQKAEYDKMLESHKSKLRVNFYKLSALQKKLDDSTGEFADRKKTKEISHEISLIEQANRESSIDLFYDLYSILDKDQKEKLKKRFRDKSKRFQPRGKPGDFKPPAPRAPGRRLSQEGEPEIIK